MSTNSNSSDKNCAIISKYEFGAVIFVLLIIIGTIAYLIYADKINKDTTSTVAAVLSLCIIVPYFIWISWLGAKGCNDNWYKNPLGLPRGSIRGLITLLFVMTALLSLSAIATNDWLMGIIGTIIGFYFGDKRSEQDQVEE